jgi:hypothetical protein
MRLEACRLSQRRLSRNLRLLTSPTLKRRPIPSIFTELCCTMHFNILPYIDTLLGLSSSTLTVERTNPIAGLASAMVAVYRQQVWNDLLNEWAERGKTCAEDAAIQLDDGPVSGGRVVPEGVGGMYALVKGGEADERDGTRTMVD